MPISVVGVEGARAVAVISEWTQHEDCMAVTQTIQKCIEAVELLGVAAILVLIAAPIIDRLQ